MRTLLRLAVLGLCSVTLFAESAAGVRWAAPDGWTSAGPRPMRAATYTIAPVSPDAEPAECAVNYFGPGAGGSVAANIDRWKGQMQGPGGRPGAANVVTRTVSGLTVTTIDASGAYSGMGGPMASGTTVVQGYRLLGAIVEAPGGTVFFKLVGPARTVGANTQKFDRLIASLQLEK